MVPNTRSQYGALMPKPRSSSWKWWRMCSSRSQLPERACAACGGAGRSGSCRRPGSRRGSRRRTPSARVGAEHEPEQRVEDQRRAARDAAGGMTSRSGSFGWSWWTPWTIQCSRAPMPVLGLEVEDHAVHPVLGERPERVAADGVGRARASSADAVRRRSRSRSAIAGRKIRTGTTVVDAREAVEQPRLEHRRGGLQELACGPCPNPTYQGALTSKIALVDPVAPARSRPPIASMARFMLRLVSRIQPISPHFCGRARRPCRSARRTAPRRRPVCWYAGLTPRKPTRTRSMIWPLRRKCHQPSGSSRPVHLLQHLVDVRDRDRDRRPSRPPASRRP